MEKSHSHSKPVVVVKDPSESCCVFRLQATGELASAVPRSCEPGCPPDGFPSEQQKLTTEILSDFATMCTRHGNTPVHPTVRTAFAPGDFTPRVDKCDPVTEAMDAEYLLESEKQDTGDSGPCAWRVGSSWVAGQADSQRNLREEDVIKFEGTQYSLSGCEDMSWNPNALHPQHSVGSFDIPAREMSAFDAGQHGKRLSKKKPAGTPEGVLDQSARDGFSRVRFSEVLETCPLCLESACSPVSDTVFPPVITEARGIAPSEQQTAAEDRKLFRQAEQPQQADGRGAPLLRDLFQATPGFFTDDLGKPLLWANQAICQVPTARETSVCHLQMTGALVQGLATLHSRHQLPRKPDGSYEILPSRGMEEAEAETRIAETGKHSGNENRLCDEVGAMESRHRGEGGPCCWPRCPACGRAADELGFVRDKHFARVCGPCRAARVRNLQERLRKQREAIEAVRGRLQAELDHGVWADETVGNDGRFEGANAHLGESQDQSVPSEDALSLSETRERAERNVPTQEECTLSRRGTKSSTESEHSCFAESSVGSCPGEEFDGKDAVLSSRRSSFLSAYSQLSVRSTVSDGSPIDEAAAASSLPRLSSLTDRGAAPQIGSGEEVLSTGLSRDGLHGRRPGTTGNGDSIPSGQNPSEGFEAETERGQREQLNEVRDLRQRQDVRDTRWGLAAARKATYGRQNGDKRKEEARCHRTASDLRSLLRSVRQQVSEVRSRRSLLEAHLHRQRLNVLSLLISWMQKRICDGEDTPFFTDVQGNAVTRELNGFGAGWFCEGNGTRLPLQDFLNFSCSTVKAENDRDGRWSYRDEVSVMFDDLANLERLQPSSVVPSGLEFPRRHFLVDGFRGSGAGPSAFSDVSAELRITKEALYQVRSLRCQEVLGLFAFQRSEGMDTSACCTCRPATVPGGAASAAARVETTDKDVHTVSAPISTNDFLPRREQDEIDEEQRKGTWTQVSPLDGGLWKPESFFSSRKEALLDLQASLNLLAYIVAALASYLDVLLPFPVYILPSSSPLEQQPKRKTRQQRNSFQPSHPSSRIGVSFRQSGSSRRLSFQREPGVGSEGVERNLVAFTATVAPPSAGGTLETTVPAIFQASRLRVERGDELHAQISGPPRQDDACQRPLTTLGEWQGRVREEDFTGVETLEQDPSNASSQPPSGGQSEAKESSVHVASPSLLPGASVSSLAPSSSADVLCLNNGSGGITLPHAEKNSSLQDAGSPRALLRRRAATDLAARNVAREEGISECFPSHSGSWKYMHGDGNSHARQEDSARRTDRHEERTAGEHTFSASPVLSSLLRVSPWSSTSCSFSGSCVVSSSLHREGEQIPARSATELASTSSVTESSGVQEEPHGPSRFLASSSEKVFQQTGFQVRGEHSPVSLLATRFSIPTCSRLLNVQTTPSDFRSSASRAFESLMTASGSLSVSTSAHARGTDGSQENTLWSVVDSLFPRAAERLWAAAARGGFSPRLQTQRPRLRGERQSSRTRSLAQIVADRLPAILHSVGPAAARFSPRRLAYGMPGEAVGADSTSEDRRTEESRAEVRTFDAHEAQGPSEEWERRKNSARSERGDSRVLAFHGEDAQLVSPGSRDEGKGVVGALQAEKERDRGNPHSSWSCSAKLKRNACSFSSPGGEVSGECEESSSGVRRSEESVRSGALSHRDARRDTEGERQALVERKCNKTLFGTRNVGLVYSGSPTTPEVASSRDRLDRSREKASLPLFSWSAATMAAAAAAARHQQSAHAARRKAAFRGDNRGLDRGFDGEARSGFQPLRGEERGKEGKPPRQQRARPGDRETHMRNWRRNLSKEDLAPVVGFKAGGFHALVIPTSTSRSSSLFSGERSETVNTQGCRESSAGVEQLPGNENDSSKDGDKGFGGNGDRRPQDTRLNFEDTKGAANMFICEWHHVHLKTRGSFSDRNAGTLYPRETATRAITPTAPDEAGEKETPVESYLVSAKQAPVPSLTVASGSRDCRLSGKERENNLEHGLDLRLSQRPVAKPENSSAEIIERDTRASLLERRAFRRGRELEEEREIFVSLSGASSAATTVEFAELRRCGGSTLGKEEGLKRRETRDSGGKGWIGTESGEDSRARESASGENDSLEKEFANSWRMEHCEDDEGEETDEDEASTEAAAVDFRVARAVIVHRGTGEAFRLSVVDGDVKPERLQTTLQLLNWDLLALHLGKEGVLPPAAIWSDTLALLAALMNSEAFSACGPFLSSFGSADLRVQGWPESSQRAPWSYRFLSGAATSLAPGGGVGAASWSRLSATMQSFPPLLLLSAAVWGRAAPPGPLPRQNEGNPLALSCEHPGAQRTSVVLLETGRAGGKSQAAEEQYERAAPGEMIAGLLAVSSLLDEHEEDGWMLIDDGPTERECTRGASAGRTVPTAVSVPPPTAERGGETLKIAMGKDKVSSGECLQSVGSPVLTMKKKGRERMQMKMKRPRRQNTRFRGESSCLS
ncbi:hypothetical protein TGPRC2_206380 [Toxoplasma gondii TgCatPRC2]|uniref:Uncharacterized protein n=1 Tax=Toxoplasma gondii TgCatPRC2 TaxID=1130821 RepID=A0A151H460_TOXGO|nr:hypothetical protein TGPRC2_206380 [Toxoplasma gondii TgCatPRC2]